MATHVHLVLLASLLAVVSQSQPINFTYNGFNGSDMDVKSDAKVRPSGAIQLTSQSDLVIGYAFFPRPLRLPINTTTASCSLSFSTQFVFTIIPPSSGRGGYGLAFFLSPSNQFPGAEARHYLGLFNSLNDGNSSNHIFAVEFDTVKGHNEPEDYDANHIGINLNGMSSNITEMAAYTRDGTEVKRDVALGGGKPIQAWIDYDGVNKYINVTVSPIDISKPEKPLISKEINLSSVLQEKMFVGFSAATGTRPKSSSHYLLAWSFSTEGVARPINISMIPVPPVEGKSSSFQLSIKVLLGFLSVLIVILVVTLLIVFKRRLQFDRLEDWELDCPHRFNYRDLHEATKGFGDSELVGSGGFGTVYKGVMPSSGAEVAVKRIAKHSIQGLREFAAEIESLGRLRHKNLVNLQGWCKRKNDLLLIYDYIPNGSLDSLLLNPKHDFVLCWERRFNIVRGIAAGLLYLHEEWEKVVIHRDVKSSNVLIDAEMNARLGDFGLARLYDHGEISSRTTNVVGTIGYIAPELAQTGKASTSSDVFAYGVLLLEVVCGRGPVVLHHQRGHVGVVDWAVELLQGGDVLDVVDPRLGSDYVLEEVELVVCLGLLCSHPKPEARPTMRQITRYLDGDDLLPGIERLTSARSGDGQDTLLRFLGVISANTNGTSYPSSSVGHVSSNSSIFGGR